MTWLVVILVFVGLGVVVVAAAFGGRRPRTAQPSRASRRATAVGLAALILVTAVGLPAVLLATNGSEEADAAGGLHLNASETRGRALFARNCSNCHTLAAANGVGKVGPNLDVLRPQTALVVDAVRNGRARGAGQMPQGLLSGQDLTDVANFVAQASGR